MPPSDQEPRYRLVDSNGNVVGSLFQNSDGNVEIQDETGTGSVFGPDGIVTPAIDTGSVSADELLNGRTSETLMGQSTAWSGHGFNTPDDPDDTTSSSYTSIAQLTGLLPADEIPDGTTLYANFGVRVTAVPSGETANYRPRAFGVRDGDLTTIELDELEITADENDGYLTSGWTEITSFNPTNWELLISNDIQAKVSSGTLETRDRRFHGVGFTWRVD